MSNGGAGAAPTPARETLRFPGEDGGKSLSEMAQRDLDATLQLLTERAQYISGASGAAIALRDGENMVCCASSGDSAPHLGAICKSTPVSLQKACGHEKSCTAKTLKTTPG